MKTALKKCVLVTALAAATVNFSGCAKSANGDPLNIQLAFGTYTTAQHKSPLLKLFEIKQANAAVTSLKMCFKRLRFKANDVNTTSPATDSGNVDFPIGEITVSAAGASLGAVTVPAGTYRRIEFDLDSHCASGKSVQLVNGNGSFSSNQTITVKFSGAFDANVDGTLTLGVQTILDQMNAYNGTDLKTALEGVSGNLRN